ncbi:MAG: hypothetical protein K2R98_11070 [Gemmataceae bacterium]|nr:hypothetical protein [Gemmataceae bacterium]
MRTTLYTGIASLVACFAVLYAPFSAADPPAAANKAAAEKDVLTPTGYTMDKTQHVFYRDGQGAIMELFNKEGTTDGWQRKDLSAEAGAPKAAGNPSAYVMDSDKTQHVICRCGDGNIHELFWSGKQAKWQHTNLTEQTKAPKAVGDPSGYYLPENKTQHVVYRTDAGNICELYFQADGDKPGWRVKDLTAEAKSPKAAGNPSGYAVPEKLSRLLKNGGTQHVVYRGTDGQLHELFLSLDQNKWMHANLSEGTKAAKAAGDPCGCYRKDDNTQHIYFRTADNNIGELSLSFDGDDKSWRFKDLSAECNAPKAEGDPCGYFQKKDNTQHVVYRGKDGEIFEVYFAKDHGKWQSNNLSKATGAPKATGNPFGYVLDTNKTQHVLYPATDGVMAELYHVPDGADAGWHLNKLIANVKGK